MKRHELTAMFRKETNAIARKVARMLNLSPAPICTRISRSRGRARFGAWRFSVPWWIVERHPAYRLWYIAHEVCHFVEGGIKHGPKFWMNEATIMERLGWRIVRAERGPYIQEIRDLETGFPVCDQFGRAC